MSLNHQDVNTEEQATVPAAAVREQLERLVESPPFNHSRRFPTFLRFVIEHTLKGNTDQLKERTIGIEVFGRGVEYDTASDPIVRVTAAEIRKRIAQYYAIPEHQNQLRVSLPSGSYIPQFHWPPQVDLEATVAPRPAQETPATRSSSALHRLTLVLCALVLFAAGLASGWYFHASRSTIIDYFWAPVLHSSDPVLFCVADQNEYTAIALRDATDPSRQTVLKDNLTAVVFDDLNPVVKIAGILQSHGKQYSLRGESATTLSELRNGTTIVVGAFDNAWALRLTKPLRYHFDNDPAMTVFRIVDTASTPHAPWTVNRLQQMNTNNYKDYALVARFTDPTTGKMAIVAAGIARGGTIAAGEFLTDPGNLAQLELAARRAGNKANMEFVLSTQIINGEPGMPTLEASYFW
jgi:hypothetical protein